MSAWITPALAAVFWAGLLLQPLVGRFADPWAWLGRRALLLVAVAIAPERRIEGVARAGGADRPLLAIRERWRRRPRRAPAGLALSAGRPRGGAAARGRLGERARAPGPGRAGRAHLGFGHRRGVAPRRPLDRARSVVGGARRPLGPMGRGRGERSRNRLVVGTRRAPEPSAEIASGSPGSCGRSTTEASRCSCSGVASRRSSRSTRSSGSARGLRAGSMGPVVPLRRRPLDRVVPASPRSRPADGARARGRLEARPRPRTRFPRDRPRTCSWSRGQRRDGARPDRGARGGAPTVALAAVRPRAGTVAFFVVLTGAEPSVMRAGVMAGLALTGILLGRPRSTGRSLPVPSSCCS